MLKYRHIKKLFGTRNEPMITEDYSTGILYKIESMYNDSGNYFKVTKQHKDHKIITIYYEDGNIVEYVEQIK